MTATVTIDHLITFLESLEYSSASCESSEGRDVEGDDSQHGETSFRETSPTTEKVRHDPKLATPT